jgi:hypothetical protein
MIARHLRGAVTISPASYVGKCANSISKSVLCEAFRGNAGKMRMFTPSESNEIGNGIDTCEV